MNYNYFFRTSLLASITTVLLAVPAIAESIGFVTFGAGYTNGDHNDPESDESFSGGHGVLRGSYAMGLGIGTLVFDASIRSDNIGPLDSGTDAMDGSAYLTSHYLWTLPDGVMLGGFAGIAQSNHAQTGFSVDEDYLTGYGGFEAIRPMNETSTLYGQFTFGNTINLGVVDSGGFNQGRAIRLGLQNTGWADNTLTVEIEAGRSIGYEDGGEDGQFASLLLSMQRPINDNTSVGFEIRHSLFNALGDSDILRETTAQIGIKIHFGSSRTDAARAGIIGTPYIPVRAPDWVPALD